MERVAVAERTERNPVGTLELIGWNAQVAGLEVGVLEHGAESGKVLERAPYAGFRQAE
jgi:hypothetical protein